MVREETDGAVPASETSERAIVHEPAEKIGLDAAGYPLESIYAYENVDLDSGV